MRYTDNFNINDILFCLFRNKIFVQKSFFVSQFTSWLSLRVAELDRLQTPFSPETTVQWSYQVKFTFYANVLSLNAKFEC